MTESELDADLADSSTKDQLESVDVRFRMPRAMWVEVLRAMKAYRISMVGDYIANLIRHDHELREQNLARDIELRLRRLEQLVDALAVTRERAIADLQRLPLGVPADPPGEETGGEETPARPHDKPPRKLGFEETLMVSG